MIYSDITFNFVLYQERSENFLEWNMFSLILKKFCNSIKTKYKCEWSYGRGDGSVSYLSFCDHKFTEKEYNEIEKKVKTIGEIVNIILFSPTTYRYGVLMCYNPDKYNTGYNTLKFFNDSDFNQYKKIVGSYNFYSSYYNRELKRHVHYTGSYLNYVQPRNYLKSKKNVI
jgi:hypothetical protein